MAAGYNAADRGAIPATGSPRRRAQNGHRPSQASSKRRTLPKPGEPRPLGQIGLGAKLGLIAEMRSRFVDYHGVYVMDRGMML
jgi:hypothetical protein